jgi:hypothetical protein
MSDNAGRSTPRRWRKRWIIPLSVVLVLAAVWLTWLALAQSALAAANRRAGPMPQRPATTPEIERGMAELRTAMTWWEGPPTYLAKSGQDEAAYTDLEAAFSYGLSPGWSAEQWSRASLSVAAIAPGIEAIDRALSLLPRLRPTPLAGWTSDSMHLRPIGKCLAARAMIAVHEQRYQDAFDDVMRLTRWARVTASSGTSIELVLGISLHTLAAQQLRQVLSRTDCPLSTQGWWHAADELRELDRRALDDDRIAVSDVFRRLDVADSKVSAYFLQSDLPRWTNWKDWPLQSLRDSFQVFRDRAYPTWLGTPDRRLDEARVMQVWADARDACDAGNRVPVSSTSEFDDRFGLVVLLIDMRKIMLTTDHKLRLSTAYIDLHEYRWKHGIWPTSPSQLPSIGSATTAIRIDAEAQVLWVDDPLIPADKQNQYRWPFIEPEPVADPSSNKYLRDSEHSPWRIPDAVPAPAAGSDTASRL